MKTRLKFALLICLAIVLCFNLAVMGCPTPEPKSITPAKGLVNEKVTATIDGAWFHRSVTVKLSKEGQPDISGIIIKRTASRIICTFDLSNAAIGSWDVVVTSKGSFTKKLRNGYIKSGFTVVYPAPTATAVSPEEGENNDTYTLDITGTEFRKGAAVKLVKSGQKDIVAENVNVESATSITCDVDLSNAKTDKYDVVVMNDDNQFATLKEAFAITQAQEEEPAIDENATEDTEPALDDDQGTEAVEDQGTEATDEDQAVDADQATEDETPDPNSLLKPIFFDYDQYAIRQDQTDQLENDIAVLKENESMVVVLGGHADERGTAQYNIQLSALRAEAIKNYLIDKGVDPSQITNYAYGKDHPAKNGHDESAWSFNRRVDISLWDSAPSKDDAVVDEVNQ